MPRSLVPDVAGARGQDLRHVGRRRTEFKTRLGYRKRPCVNRTKLHQKKRSLTPPIQSLVKDLGSHFKLGLQI